MKSFAHTLLAKWVDITSPTSDLVDTDNKEVQAVIHLDQSAPRLAEEVGELMFNLEADDILSEGNKVKLLDDVVDCYFVAAQQMQILAAAGFDVVGAFDTVCENNDTKFVKNERDAQETVDDYIKKGVDCFYEFNETYGVYVVRRQSDLKILKPLNYQSVDLSAFIPR